MIKKTIIGAACLLIATSASARDYYLGANAGAAFSASKLDNSNLYGTDKTQKSLKTAPAVSLFVGKDLGNGFAAEIEAYYSRANFKNKTKDKPGAYDVKAKISSLAAFVNAKYEFTGNDFVPYVLVGAGYSKNSVRSFAYDNSKNLDAGITAEVDKFKNLTKGSFAWQVGAGLRYPFKDGLNFDLNFKYRGLGKIKSSDYSIINNGKDENGPNLIGKARYVSVMTGLTFDL